MSILQINQADTPELEPGPASSLNQMPKSFLLETLQYHPITTPNSPEKSPRGISMINVQSGLSVFGGAKVAVDETRPIGQSGERGEVGCGWDVAHWGGPSPDF
ncbi:hypothetical protein N7501_009120 [Penicillium viridicatum]|nr:hypothetical protein N7501_009120 [Penicillium viridicatum]